jgi:hypothetical protein
MSDQAKHICGEYLPYMRNKYGMRESDVYIDPACKALRLEIEKFSIMTSGADNNAHDIKGSTKGLMCGIEMLQSSINDGRFYLVEDERYGTEPFIKEAGLYCVNEKGVPVDAYNHVLDATRYASNHYLKSYGLWN